MCHCVTWILTLWCFCFHSAILGSEYIEYRKQGLSACASVPPTFRKHWQVIGQKGRQLWINKYYLRILGPVDDVFGNAAGGAKLLWYNLKCNDDMLQLKSVISESRSRDAGEYMCLRLTKLEGDVEGTFVREVNKLSKKYRIDCEFWSDGIDRRAYKFHLTDNPSWADLLTKHDSFQQADGDLKMKKCSEIPQVFHGDWKLSNSDKMVEFRKRYYRAYGAHGKDPFWRTNTELTFYSLICNRRRFILKTYMWELPAGSRSQLQCLTLRLDGEYDITGHAVNMVASKAAGSNAPPEIDCDHSIGKDYTRYPIHLTRQLDKKLAPKPIHTISEPEPVEYDDDESYEQSDSFQLAVTDTPLNGLLMTDVPDEQQLPADINYFKSHKEHRPSWESASYEIRPQSFEITFPNTLPSDDRKNIPALADIDISRSKINYHNPPWWYRLPHRYPPYPPQYWIDKREYHSPPQDKRELGDGYETPQSFGSQILHAINQQTMLLQGAVDKLTAYIDKNSVTTTQDWNYVKPYLKQDVMENMEKKKIYEYYGDD